MTEQDKEGGPGGGRRSGPGRGGGAQTPISRDTATYRFSQDSRRVANIERDESWTSLDEFPVQVIDSSRNGK